MSIFRSSKATCRLLTGLSPPSVARLCGPETFWMQTTKEMAHREGSLEQSAIVKSGSALPYFSLLSSFLTTVDLSYDNLICFPWNTVVFPLLAILPSPRPRLARGAASDVSPHEPGQHPTMPQQSARFEKSGRLGRLRRFSTCLLSIPLSSNVADGPPLAL